MRALRVVELRGAEGLRVTDVAGPPGQGDIVVSVKAVGIGYSTFLRSVGRYQERWEPPYTLEGEIAGVVLEAPAGSRLTPGDRIAAPSADGRTAELVLIPAGAALKLPDGISFEEAACLRNLETALFALDLRGRARSGETVLVHGAGGGAGVAALQVAGSLGCRAIAAVSSPEKERIAQRAGADEVVRTDGDWKGEVLRATTGRGVDIVFDPVGGDLMLDTLRVLAEGGRWIVFGFTGGIPQIPANRVLLRNVDVVGAYRTGYFARHPDEVARIDARLLAMLDAGRLRPIVGSVFPFERGADALRAIERREAVGQVVLTP